MGDVKWVKLTTDMFDNRKIKHLRKLPEGNNIVLIWVMLLTMAGRCNAGGMIFLTENIPYTPKMLADELDFEENTVILALRVLEQLDMVIADNEFFKIAGWNEYQNIDGLDKIREQTRKRVAKHREKKLISECNVTSNATVTQSNATDKNRKEIDKNKSRFIPPTADEVAEYCKERGNSIDPEEFIDFYTANGWVQGKGKPIKDWKACIRTWESKRKAEQPREELDPNTIKRREKYKELENYYLGEE